MLLLEPRRGPSEVQRCYGMLTFPRLSCCLALRGQFVVNEAGRLPLQHSAPPTRPNGWQWWGREAATACCKWKVDARGCQCPISRRLQITAPGLTWREPGSVERQNHQCVLLNKGCVSASLRRYYDLIAMPLGSMGRSGQTALSTSAKNDHLARGEQESIV